MPLGIGSLRQPLLIAYIWALPFLWPTLFTIPVLGKPVVLADLAFALVVGTLLLSPGAFRAPRRGLIAVASFPLAAIALSALANDAWPAGRRELLRVGYSMSVLLLFAHLKLDASQLRRLGHAWLTACVLVCAVGLVSFLGVTVLGWPENHLAKANSPNLGNAVVRVNSVLHANSLSLYVQTGVAFWFVLATSRQPLTRGLQALLGIPIATAVLTFSRGLAGLLVELALQARASREALPAFWRQRHWLSTLAAMVVAATIAATIWAIVPVRIGERSGDALPGIDLNTQENAYFVLHSAALRMFGASPLVGIGPGRFGAQLRNFSSREARARAWPPLSSSRNWDPHSAWFGVLAETGILGLASWVALLGWILYVLVARAQPGDTLLDAGRAASFAVVGLLVNGLHVSHLHLKFIWAFMGLALASRILGTTRVDCSRPGVVRR